VADLLPPNATQLERDIEAAAARLSAVDVSPTSDIWNPDTCPAHLLPWLAWAEQVAEWSSLWSEAVQRAVIKAQRLVRKKRGTKSAVVSAVEALSGSATIKEWFEHSPQKAAHTFDITISGGDGYIEAELQESMIRSIDRSKPVRSHYTLGIGLTAAAKLNIIGVARVANYKRMEFTD
jgi:phage tail P2-like protein